MQRIGFKRWAAAGLCAVAVGAGVLALSCSGSRQATVQLTQADKIARGKVISYSSGCIDCHTPGTFYGLPDTSRMLSGSELGWEGPWGVTFPRNLTPDPETGIASWTEEQIVAAVRTGIRPDGTQLLPPMPWPAYSRMSDEDAFALAAYLKSIPAVKHKAPDRIPPGTAATGPRLTFPPPPAWDAMHLPPPAETEEEEGT